MTTALATVTVTEMERIADDVVKSGLFGFKTNAQAIAIMALCQADGIHPATAIRDYHVIQGRPAMKADAMLARFQKAGSSSVCIELTHLAAGLQVEAAWAWRTHASLLRRREDRWKRRTTPPGEPCLP